METRSTLPAPELAWVPDERNALEQVMLLQPQTTGCISVMAHEPPDSGQFVWRRGDFRIFWIFRSSLCNIGCRGHFREQIEDGCCLLIPAGIPVFFWREGNSSYCSDIEFDAQRCEVDRLSAERRSPVFLESTPDGAMGFAAVAFSLNEHLSKLAMPIFSENTVFRVGDPAFEPARQLLTQVLAHARPGDLLGTQLVKTFLMSLIDGANRTRQLVMTEVPREAAENPHIMEVLRIISERMNDSSLNLESIASAVHLNASYLSGLFSQLMRKTLVRYIQEKRVLAARRLLLTNPYLSIKEIMGQVGINTPQQMSRTFKKILGCSPSAFRASVEEAVGEDSGDDSNEE